MFSLFFGGMIMKLKKIIYCFTFLALLFLLPAQSHATSLDNWVMVTSPSNNWYYGITYGNGTFVTVGAYAAILTSADGVAWASRTAPITNHLYGVGFGNGTFVAVGKLGRILSSSDNGVTWTLRSTGQIDPVYDDLFGVTYGNGMFVIVGGNGTIRTSADNGVTWADPFWPYSSLTDNWLYGAVYDNSTFAGVGAYGTSLYSPDGASWSPGNSGTGLHLMGVAYGNSTFVAVGENGAVLTSLNGVNWSELDEENKVTDEWLRGIKYDNGTFVAVGDYGTIITSPDGINWTSRNSGITYDLQAVAYGNAFAAVGGYGAILLDGDSLPDLNGDSQPDPVRVWRGYAASYASSVQSAYASATDGDAIQTTALEFNENLTLDAPISVTLEGGYNSTFSDNPSYTTINGTLTISGGSVTIENIVIR
jgi:photosystem II stability/assembly factor-like uncharacterized protein